MVHDKCKFIYASSNYRETLESSAALYADFLVRINPHGKINVGTMNKT